MKKKLKILLAICICGTSLFAQATKSKSIRQKITIVNATIDRKKNGDCVFYNKFTPKQRMSRYPFSRSVKVLAVSFKSFSGSKTNVTDTLLIAPIGGLHIENGVLDTSTLIERELLDTKQIDELTNLLFNTNYRKVKASYVEETMGCFEPRNAFIFIDADGRIFDYITICFACLKSRSDSDKLDLGILCTQKYQMVSDYFKKVGVSYGTLGRDYHKEKFGETP